MELSRYVFSSLREGDFNLYRGSGNGLTPILFVTAENASLGSFKRLEHEYALKAELDAAWAARPVVLFHYNDRMTLVLDDPGGEVPDRLLGQPLDTLDFLRIAIQLANALGRVHQQGLIHKDIKPANILVDAVSGKDIGRRGERQGPADRLRHCYAGTSRASGPRSARKHCRNAGLYGAATDRPNEPFDRFAKRFVRIGNDLLPSAHWQPALHRY